MADGGDESLWRRWMRSGAVAAEKVEQNVPVLEDEIVIEVLGQPGHTKQNLYYLALAAANGIVPRYNTLFGVTQVASPSYGMLMIEYDPADKWVRCRIRYRTGMLGASAYSRAEGLGTIIERLAVYRGPQCNVVGGKFNFVNVALPGVPPRATDEKAPKLPFEGQMILTTCPTTPPPTVAPITQNPAPTYPISNPQLEIPSPNPKPPGDNRSRGAVTVVGAGGPVPEGDTRCCDRSLALIPLVFAALSSPSTNADMRWVPPVQGPTGS